MKASPGGSFFDPHYDFVAEMHRIGRAYRAAVEVSGVTRVIHLSSIGALLRSLTGQSTQWHIHDKLINYAKLKLSTTDRSVSETAYDLGFEHPQSFSKLFKAKTQQSPLAFRASFR